MNHLVLTYILMKISIELDGRPKSEENIPKISNCYLFLHWVFYLFLLRSSDFWHNLTPSIKPAYRRRIHGRTNHLIDMDTICPPPEV
jgi:hypothetical protein